MAQSTSKAKQPAKTQSKPPKVGNQQNFLVFGAVIVIALVGVAAVVFFSLNNSGSTSGVNYAAIPDIDDTSVSDSELEYGAVRQWRLPDGGFIIGDPNAPITIVEFADFLCPHCQDYKSTVNRVIEELVLTGQAKFEYRMYSTQGPNSVFVANFAECAAGLVDGGFWEVHDEVFALTSSQRVTAENGELLAEQLGVNYAEVLQCIRDDAGQIDIDQRVGAAAGVSATPGMRVRYGENGQLQPIPGYERGGAPFSVLETTVSTASFIQQ